MAYYLDSPEREPMIDLLLQYGSENNLENEVGETLLFAFIDGKFDDSIDLIRELRKWCCSQLPEYQPRYTITSLSID